MGTITCKPTLEWKDNKLYCGKLHLATLDAGDGGNLLLTHMELEKMAKEYDLNVRYEDRHTEDFGKLHDGEEYPLERCRELLEKYFTHALDLIPARLERCVSHSIYFQPSFDYEWRGDYLEIGSYEFPEMLGDVWGGNIFLGELRFQVHNRLFVFTTHAFPEIVRTKIGLPIVMEDDQLFFGYPILNPRKIIERLYNQVFAEMQYTLIYA